MSEVTATGFRDALFTAFDEFWADRTPVAWPNKPFDPQALGEDDADAYVRPFILGDPDGQTRLSNSVARDHFIRAGQFTIELYSRMGQSTDRVYELAEAVLAWLANPGVTETIFSQISSPQEIGALGSWYQVNITANWRYFTDLAAS